MNKRERDRIRRAYLSKGPCQLRLTNYPVTLFSGKPRKFNPDWYGAFYDWLEYSESKDAKATKLLRVKQIEKVVEGISQGTLETGRGMNQEVTLKHPGETRWSSHYNTIISVISLFSPTLEVLEEMKNLPSFVIHKGEISRLIEVMCEFEFAFLLYFMKKVFAITNDLSQALQRKDQDLPNAMGLVKVAKRRLQELRENGWDNLLVDVSRFCEKNEIHILNMNETYVPRGRSKRNIHKVTNHHHYKT
ncbi:uncharacterized protein LOC141719333 [Apium graveolens]|uniref:uncharacterized protein LOC141719333 n=1 Tax=Apium graveolens TaxID=4045 RepID=UPI003D7B379F